jgi:hypothetical protein
MHIKLNATVWNECVCALPTYFILSTTTLCSLQGSCIHLVVCLTTGPKPPPKRALHIVRSGASSFKWEDPLLSLRLSSSFLRLLPRLSVTSIPPCIFPSITRCRRQFLCKMWPIQLAFRLLILCRIFLCSLTLSNTSSFLTWSVQLRWINSRLNYNDHIPTQLRKRSVLLSIKV